MSELRELYQEVILDHNRSPRNFRVMPDADRKVEGYNPLCGDKYTLYLKLSGETIEDISFEGSGCAISKASASVMTSAVKGKTREEAHALFEHFHRLVKGESPANAYEDGPDALQAFAGVAEFPMRVKCAALAWHTLRAAIESKKESVSTE